MVGCLEGVKHNFTLLLRSVLQPKAAEKTNNAFALGLLPAARVLTPVMSSPIFMRQSDCVNSSKLQSEGSRRKSLEQT